MPTVIPNLMAKVNWTPSMKRVSPILGQISAGQEAFADAGEAGKPCDRISNAPRAQLEG
jgi:hypothetical protein